jgi:UDP-N-acetyl-D-mannosaminuronate dehydrogenase
LKVGILGQGEIGTANREYLLGLGHEIFTFDPLYNDDFGLPNCDTYLINTGSENVLEAVGALSGRTGHIVIESTVKAGTCKKAVDLLDGKHVIYCPQRYWKDDPYKRGIRRHRLVSGTSRNALSKGLQMYRIVFDMPVYPVWPVEVAELAKVAENAYRGVQIAFAQELALYCQKEGYDFEHVREAIMTADDMHWIAEARDGIGGHCIPMAMTWLNDFRTVQGAVLADDAWRDNQ